MGAAGQLRKFAAIIILLAGLTALIVVAIISGTGGRRVFVQDQPDQCMGCHADVPDMSSAHPSKALGCTVCHLGNAFATGRKTAHAGMADNPSDLDHVMLTCGRPDCHPSISAAVQKSIMASNNGLGAATLFQWQEGTTRSDTLLHIAGNLPDSSLATSHIRKLCAGCHINKKQNDLPGEFGRRGGGCNDCHLQKDAAGAHPKLTVQMDIATCEKCHNRSNRTALNYQGKFESEGYGTPYQQGNLSADTLSGARFYYHLPADVHFEAGMVCIDCHVAEGVMGDGSRHAHLEDQVQVACIDCHAATFGRPRQEAWLWKIIEVNPNLSVPADSQFARTSGGSWLPNVVRRDRQIILNLKTSVRQLPVRQIASESGCRMPGHERLACQACHSAWSPQCYGCHDLYERQRKQLDKVSYKETAGHWTEGRSWLRFERPALGLDQFDRVMPFAPGCQVYLSEKDDAGITQAKATWLTMAAFDPHTTRLAVPACIDCHSNPKRLGLGEGEIIADRKRQAETARNDFPFRFEPVYAAQAAGLGRTELTGLGNIRGKALQKMSRRGERPFTAQELKRIYRVSLCIVCHDDYNDPIYRDFQASVTNYRTNRGLPCREEVDISTGR